MSIIKINRKPQFTPGNLAAAIQTEVHQRGASLAAPNLVRGLTSGLESLNDSDRHMAEAGLNDVTGVITSAASALGAGDLEKQYGPGLEAAAVVLAARGDLKGYARAALTNEATGSNMGQTLFGASAAAMDYANEVASLEAFDDAPLLEMLGYSATFNLEAAKQDAFGEAFFKTIVVTPEVGGIDVSCPRLTVFNRAVHSTSGKQIDWERKSIIDAYVDPTILADNATDLVPHKRADQSNAGMFVSAAAGGASVVTVSGVGVPTAPLAVNKKIDLLGISQHEQLLNMQVLDINDAVDKSVKITSLRIQFDEADPAVKLNTTGMPQAQFVKGPEGNYRQLILALDSLASLDGTVKAVDGSDVPQLAALAAENLRVTFEITAGGGFNVQTGTVSVNPGPLTVRSIIDITTGEEIDRSAGVGADLVAAFEDAKIVGYKLAAKRTNSNRRTVGLRLDSSLHTNRFPISIGSPISIQTPHSSNTDAADLKALITTARVRSNNNAVTALVGACDYLEETVKPFMSDDEVYEMMPGMGRFLVRPFFERRTLDVAKSLNSLTSAGRAADVSAAIVMALREITYRMHQMSNYQAAADAMHGGGAPQPTLVLGTDPNLLQHIMVPGDTRTLGLLFEKTQIVSTLDERVRGKIFIALTRPDQDGVDPLTFGYHAWIPELVTTVPNVSRDGQQIKETQVQVRNLHFINCPIAAVLEVINLPVAVVDKTATPPFLGEGDKNPYVDDLTQP